MTRMIAVLTISGLLFAGAAAAQDTVTLKGSKEARTLEVTIASKTHNEQSFGGRVDKFTIDQLAVIEMQIGQANDKGVTSVRASYKRIKRVVTSGNNVQESYDSSDKDGDKTAADTTYGPIMKAIFTFDLGADGKVSNFKDADDSGKSTNALAEQAKKKFGELLFRSMFDNELELLPAKAVAVGDTWKNEIKVEIPTLGEMKFQADLKLVWVKDGLAILSSVCKTKLDAPRKVTVGEVERTVKSMEMQQTAESLFDIKGGFMTKSSAKGVMTIASAGSDGEDVMTAKSDSQVDIVLRKISEATATSTSQPTR